MKKTNHKQKYSLIERIEIAVCIFVAIVAVIILTWSLTISIKAFSVNENKQQVTVMKETNPTVEAYIPENETTTNEFVGTNVMLLIQTTETQRIPVIAGEENNYTSKQNLKELIHHDDMLAIETTKPEIIPVIEKVEDNIYEWCLANENDDPISLWKLTDEDGNLFITLKNDKEEVIVTFKYDGIEADCYEDWFLCNYFFEQTTVSDIVDCSFTAYHEVSGNNHENVQAQVCTLINRINCTSYNDSVRGVVTQEGQYSCAENVLDRWLKKDSDTERKDIEKCFWQTLLVLAGELIQEVPTNVVYAAQGPQGSGIWKIIDGTYYCFL